MEGDSRATKAWPLIGRADALAVLEQVVDPSGPLGGAVIGGAPGTGRSRLAAEVATLAGPSGRRVQRAVARAATSALPLGALAHLLPPPAAGAGEAELLQHAVAVLGADEPGVLVVDDAHLLDPLSVALLHRLVLGAGTPVVATVPDGVHDPLAPLWRDETVARIDLGPLARPDVEDLLDRVLGEVHSRTAERLWRWSRGNPRVLRETVQHGRWAGALTAEGGPWHWAGPLRPSPRLTAAVLERLPRPGTDERAALDVLAVAGALPVRELVVLAGRDAVAGLERAGLVTVRRTEDRPGADELDVADPVHAVVLRERVPVVEAGRIRRRVAELPARCAADVLRTGQMLLDGEADDVDPRALRAAAAVALDRDDPVLAERLARAAGPAGGRDLVEALLGQGRAAEAADAARSAADDPGTRAAGVLAAGCAGTAGPAAGPAESAAAALLAAAAHRPAQAVELGRAVLADTTAPAAHPLAAAAVAVALGYDGRVEEALAALAAGDRSRRRPGGADGPRFGRLAGEHARLLALSCAGRIGDVTTAAETLRRSCDSAPGGARDALAALHLGGAALAAGRHQAGARRLAEAAHDLTDQDPLRLRGLCAAWLATAEALLGRTGAARDRLAGLATEQPWSDAEIARARVWVAASGTAEHGPVAEAAAEALGAAEEANRIGQRAIGARLLHDAARLGRADEAEQPLRRIAGQLGLPLIDVAAAHAAGLRIADPDAVERAAEGFVGLGAVLLAAEAHAAAADLRLRSGDRRRAAAAASRAQTLAARCDHPCTPALIALPAPRLTGRERDVARLAADGLSNQAIARRLVLSVRTVETHLAHSYAKLGVSGRSELRDVLPSDAARL